MKVALGQQFVFLYTPAPGQTTPVTVPGAA
jgi:hypothetical protein